MQYPFFVLGLRTEGIEYTILEIVNSENKNEVHDLCVFIDFLYKANETEKAMILLRMLFRIPLSLQLVYLYDLINNNRVDYYLSPKRVQRELDILMESYQKTALTGLESSLYDSIGGIALVIEKMFRNIHSSYLDEQEKKICKIINKHIKK